MAASSPRRNLGLLSEQEILVAFEKNHWLHSQRTWKNQHMVTQNLKTQENHFSLLQRETELRGDIDKMRSELKYEIDKVTAGQVPVKGSEPPKKDEPKFHAFTGKSYSLKR